MRFISHLLSTAPVLSLFKITVSHSATLERNRPTSSSIPFARALAIITANPNDNARTVINQIKQIDNQRIRSF